MRYATKLDRFALEDLKTSADVAFDPIVRSRLLSAAAALRVSADVPENVGNRDGETAAFVLGEAIADVEAARERNPRARASFDLALRELRSTLARIERRRIGPPLSDRPSIGRNARGLA